MGNNIVMESLFTNAVFAVIKNKLDILVLPKTTIQPTVYFVKKWIENVSLNGNTLEFVPPELKTREICLAAVSQYGLSLQFIPADKRTPEILLAAESH